MKILICQKNILFRKDKKLRNIETFLLERPNGQFGDWGMNAPFNDQGKMIDGGFLDKIVFYKWFNNLGWVPNHTHGMENI